MKIKALIFLFLSLLLSACSEPLPKEKLDYAGLWKSKEMSLLILEDGSVAYKRIKGGGSVSVNGPLQEFNGDSFSVGVAFFSTDFEVSEAPHQVDGRWEMVVDGVRLIKVEE